MHRRRVARRIPAVIVVSGTPGTGKTTLAAMLARVLGGTHVDVSRLVVEEGLWTEVDEERSSALVADVDAVRRRLASAPRSTGPLIVDSHYGEEVAAELPGEKIVIVLRLDPRLLLERLRAKSWPPRKVRENLEAEVLGVCTANALRAGIGRVCEIDATGLGPRELLEKALAILDGLEPCRVYVDWLGRLGVEALDLLRGLEE